MRPSILVLIALAGASGALARYGLSSIVHRFLGRDFPFGTLAVNVLGCLLVGVLYHQATGLSHNARVIVGSGFLGALTTFSTFGHETIEHVHEGRIGLALLNVTANLVLGLLAVALGYIIARQLGGTA